MNVGVGGGPQEADCTVDLIGQFGLLLLSGIQP